MRNDSSPAPRTSNARTLVQVEHLRLVPRRRAPLLRLNARRAESVLDVAQAPFAYPRALLNGVAMRRCKQSVAITALVFSCTAAAHAQEIVKCTDRNGVTYQSVPCPKGQRSAAIAIANAHPEISSAVATQALHTSTRPPLTVGMSDSQVLNLPRWGRPSKITRNKTKSAWHEHWVYVSPAAGIDRLHFANGTLMEFDSTPALAAAGEEPSLTVTLR